MIPFILLGVGAYMIADSVKSSKSYADGGYMAKGGNISPIYFKSKSGIQGFSKDEVFYIEEIPSYGNVKVYYYDGILPRFIFFSKSKIQEGFGNNDFYEVDKSLYKKMHDGGMMDDGGDIKEIEVKKSGVEIEISKEDEDDDDYMVSYEKDGMEIFGTLIPYYTGRTTKYEFSPDSIDDKATEDYYADHWEEIEDEILKVFYKNAYKKGGKI